MAEYKYKSISVHEDDYEFYDKIREKLSRDVGAKLSVAQALKVGMKFYNDRRKFVKEEVNN